MQDSVLNCRIFTIDKEQAMKTLLWIVLFTLPCVVAQAKMQIASHGKAQCSIVTQPDATPAERYAAKELAGILHQITGATFPVMESGKSLPASAIIIGQGAVA